MNKPTDMKTRETVGLWINGRSEQAQTKRFGDVMNPATGEVVRQVPFCTAADIDTAVQAAKAAFPKWKRTPVLRRARILMRYRELIEANREGLAKLVTEEHGKTFTDA